MKARDVVELLLLALLWGAAYLFMRAAVPAFGPAPLVALRLGLAAVLLAPLMFWRGGAPSLRERAVPLLVLGIPFTALPFLLLAYASQHVSAGLVAVLNATSPLFGALVARITVHERLGPSRIAGMAVAFAGVGWLMAGNVSFKTADGPLAVAAVLAASLIWGLGAHHTRRRLAGTDSIVITVGSLSAACLVLAPFAVAQWPAQPPGLRAWAELAFLGVASSGIGFLIYFRLLRRIGPTRALSVTFLNPVVAMATAAAYLGEAVTWSMVWGTAVVLAGTALALGLVGAPAAPPLPQTKEKQA